MCPLGAGVSSRVCPECNSALFYEPSTKHLICRNCGLFITREELQDIRERKKEQVELDAKERRKRVMAEYIEWLMKKAQA